jgi:hypothetical protein
MEIYQIRMVQLSHYLNFVVDLFLQRNNSYKTNLLCLSYPRGAFFYKELWLQRFVHRIFFLQYIPEKH